MMISTASLYLLCKQKTARRRFLLFLIILTDFSISSFDDCIKLFNTLYGCQLLTENISVMSTHFIKVKAFFAVAVKFGEKIMHKLINYRFGIMLIQEQILEYCILCNHRNK